MLWIDQRTVVYFIEGATNICTRRGGKGGGIGANHWSNGGARGCILGLQQREALLRGERNWVPWHSSRMLFGMGEINRESNGWCEIAKWNQNPRACGMGREILFKWCCQVCYPRSWEAYGYLQSVKNIHDNYCFHQLKIHIYIYIMPACPGPSGFLRCENHHHRHLIRRGIIYIYYLIWSWDIINVRLINFFLNFVIFIFMVVRSH